MVFAAVAAVCKYSYDEIKDAEEEAAELDALVAPLFDPKNQKEAASLPVIPKYWINVDGDWYYMAHNGIKLWMLANTYVPKEHWPMWIDASGSLRQSFSVGANTWFMWKDQDPEAVFTLRDGVKESDSWLIGETETMQVWEYGVGGIKPVSFPGEAFASLPDAFPVKMPDVAVKRAMELGAITHGPPVNVKPFDIDYLEASPSPHTLEASPSPSTKTGASKGWLWALGLGGVAALAYVYRKGRQGSKAVLRANPVGRKGKFLLDGEPIDLDEFFEVNVDGLHPDEVAKILGLKPGETFLGGGGAWAEWSIERVA